MIIDTLLHTFDKNSELPENMKNGLFKCFVNYLPGQLIIVENTDHVSSNIDFEALGVNVITFKKKLDEGRYGFLHDVYWYWFLIYSINDGERKNLSVTKDYGNIL